MIDWTRRRWARASRSAGVRGPAATVAFDLDGTLVTEPPRPLRVIPGALSTLRWCRRHGCRVLLYSMNTRETILVRLRHIGLPPHLFHAVVATPHKDPAAFDALVMPLACGGPLVTVGNSWRHDVAPALGRADAVVWVRGDAALGWKDTPADPESYPVVVAPSVARLPALMLAALRLRYDKAAWRGYAAARFSCCAGAGTNGCPTLGRATLTALPPAAL